MIPARGRALNAPAAPPPRRPALVPLLQPLTEQQRAAHEIRNRITYIAGTARTLRRLAEDGALDPARAAARLERIERAAWRIEESVEVLTGSANQATPAD